MRWPLRYTSGDRYQLGRKRDQTVCPRVGVVIKVRHEEDLVAERAELLVTVTGSSLVTGGSALRKAKEVSDLVASLLLVGRTGPTTTVRLLSHSNPPQ
jgi:hypothetical protein